MPNAQGGLTPEESHERLFTGTPHLAKDVVINGVMIEIDGEQFPWFTNGGVSIRPPSKEGQWAELTVTIPVGGNIVVNRLADDI